MPREAPVTSAVLPVKLGMIISWLLLRRIALRPFLDGVYTVGIESDVVLDRGDRAVRRLIGPDSVDRTLSAQRDAVVSAVTLVWAVRGVVGSLEQRGVHVPEWNILDRRGASLAEPETRPPIRRKKSPHRERARVRHWANRLQIAVGSLLPDAPLVHRFDLGGRNLVVHLGIAPFLTKMLALEELLSCCLGRLGRIEKDREPEMLGRIIGGAEDPLCDLGQRRHALTAARTGAH